MQNSVRFTAGFLLSSLFLLSTAHGAGEKATIIGDVLIRPQDGAMIDESFVHGFLGAAPGQKLDAQVLSRDVKALLDSGRFAYVDASTEAGTNGTATVVYTVKVRQRMIGEATFEGLKAYTRSGARKTIELKPGEFIDEALAKTAAERLRAAYLRDRYFDVAVTPVLKPVESGNGVNLILQIQEGERYRVRFPEFPGAKAIDDDRLGKLSGIHDWYNPLSWVITPRVTDTDLNLVASDARRQYLDAGYLDVVVKDPQKVYDGTDIRVLYEVEEGEIYHIGSIALSGNTLYPAQQILSTVPLKSGDIAGAAAMSDARKAVSDFYTSRGYPDTRVRPEMSVDDAHRVHLTLHIQEGALVHINSIQIRGNTTTKDKVIRREIGLNPGEPYNLVQAERSQRRLENLGYFSNVRLYDTVLKDGTRDVYYDVDEAPTGSLMLGAGFSTVDHVVGMFGISKSNFDIFNWPTFSGGGQKARLDLTVAEDATDLDISFIEPWFLDRRLSLDTDLFIKNREYDEFDERRTGFNIGLTRMVPWVGRVGLSYGLTAVSLKDVVPYEYELIDHPDTLYRFTDEDDSYLLSDVALSWVYDTRDNSMVPNRGTRALANATLYNAAFGSDYDFYELNLRVNHYLSLGYGLRLALSGRVATVDGLGGDEVPIGSRYFLGGGRNVRGFRYRNIGPKAKNNEIEGDYSPVGGQTIFWATAELSVNLLQQIRLAAFYDIGNVWEDAYDFDLGELCSSAGLGLRFDFRGFPIRLDYAFPIEKDDEWTRERRFVFWIGFDN